MFHGSLHVKWSKLAFIEDLENFERKLVGKIDGARIDDFEVHPGGDTSSSSSLSNDIKNGVTTCKNANIIIPLTRKLSL